MKGLTDSEKHSLAGGDLPSPTTAQRGETRRQSLLNLVGRFALAGGALYFALAVLSVSHGEPAPVDPTIEGYWSAIASGKATVGDGCAGASHGKPHHPNHGWITPKRAEKIFLSVPNNESVALASERYTAHAHPAGSGWDFVTAQQVKNDWERELGIRVTGIAENLFDAGDSRSEQRILHPGSKPSVWIDTYYPQLNTPVSSSVTLLSDPPVHARLREARLDGDPGSELADEVRVFHGLSVSGDVTGKYVYAGYGLKSDFELLQSKGVDFSGTIAIVKYGRNFRGLKIKAAQEAGAIGCLIYSDPGDDGELTEANGHKTYPEGPARVPSSVQRGSVQFLSKYPGDPTTPGVPAYKNATREEPTNIPSIPSLPLSYEDAVPLLQALKGKGMKAADVDESFEGGLGFHGVEYWTGPSEVDLHLVNQVNTRIMPIWNTMAVIPGHISDEVIIMGNHRDAWVLGGADPNSGTASQFEFVRGLGTLLKKGWKPLRTIILASWDGEEYGLVGSVENAEQWGEWYAANAVAYLNSDSSSSSGADFRGSASPSLASLLRSAAEDVRKPTASANESLWATRFASGPEEDIDAHFTDPKGSGIAPLGSGSDYTAFLMRYGVAATDFSFGGKSKGVYHYHSVYDSHTYMKKYGDPTFHQHVAAAQIDGLLTLRLADSPILPFNSTQYARDLGYYLDKVREIAGAGAFDGLNLDGLARAIDKMADASAKLDEERAELLKKLHKVIPRSLVVRMMHCFGVKPKLPHRAREVLKAVRRVNQKLKKLESGFISEEGITDREWYKHKGTSPGKWLGYGATTFPALTEALTIEKDEGLAQKEADELERMITGIAERLVAK